MVETFLTGFICGKPLMTNRTCRYFEGMGQVNDVKENQDTDFEKKREKKIQKFFNDFF